MMKIHKLIPALLLLGCASLQAQVTTPGLFKALKGQKDKAVQAKVTVSAKQIGMGLFTFHADYNRLPGEKTVKELSAGAKDGVEIAAESANDCLFHLVVGGYLDDPGVFAPDKRDPAKRNNAGIKKLEDCFFSYIPAAGFDRADRPLLVAPLIKGQKAFDPKPLAGKAVVLMSDLSVQQFEINEMGRVMINGKDLFDPKQPYWGGKEVVVKWPE